MECTIYSSVCIIESKEVSFLGNPIGINPRRIKLWKVLVDKFRPMLAKWKRKSMSLGGRITLIKSVLSSLSTFFLSFYKAPSKIWKDIEKIQNEEENSLGRVGDVTELENSLG